MHIREPKNGEGRSGKVGSISGETIAVEMYEASPRERVADSEEVNGAP